MDEIGRPRCFNHRPDARARHTDLPGHQQSSRWTCFGLWPRMRWSQVCRGSAAHRSGECPRLHAGTANLTFELIPHESRRLAIVSHLRRD